MSIKYKLFSALFASTMVFAGTVIAITAASNADTDRTIAEIDAYLEAREQHKAEKAQVFVPEVNWKEQQIAKITGFEVGFYCDTCKHYVASACINRMNNWYEGDPIAMVTDNNGSYYMMNPDYVTATEVNGWNYFEHANEMIEVVKEAEQRTADIWYWDNAETQSEWAQLKYICREDGMFFYGNGK